MEKNHDAPLRKHLSFLGKTKTADSKETVRVLRTHEGNLLEAVNIVLVVALWVLAVVTFVQSPDIIPTGFHADGSVREYGSRAMVFLMPVFGTFSAAMMLYAAYHPQTMVNTLTPIKNVEQTRLASQMCRVTCIPMTLMFGSVTLALGQNRIADSDTAWTLFFAFFVLVFVVAFFYSWRIFNVRNH